MFGKQSAGNFQIVRITDFSGGLNTTNSPNNIADNELVEIENFLIDERGVLKKRRGLRRINTQELVGNSKMPYRR